MQFRPRKAFTAMFHQVMTKEVVPPTMIIQLWVRADFIIMILKAATGLSVKAASESRLNWGGFERNWLFNTSVFRHKN